jgi:hypothetical protein
MGVRAEPDVSSGEIRSIVAVTHITCFFNRT